MASEQELNRAKELLTTEEARIKIKEKQRELDSDSLSLASSLVDSIKEIQGISTKRTTFDQNILNVNKQINKEILGQKSGLSDISTVTKQIAKNNDLIEKSKSVGVAISTSLNDIEKRRVRLAAERAKQISDERSIQQQILSQAEKGGKFDKEAYETSQETQASRERSLENLTAQLGPMALQAIFTEQNQIALEAQNKSREDELITLGKINDSLGITGGLTKLLGKIPGIGDKANKAFGNVSAKVKQMHDDTGKIPGRIETMGMFGKEFGNILTSAVTDPLVILSTIGSIMLTNNKKITEFERSMAMSSKEAKAFAGEFSATARTSDDINTTTANLVHNFQDMSQELGFIARFTQETLATATKLQYTLGLSASATSNLSAASSLTDESFESQYQNALATSYALQQQEGVQLNLKGILEESGKVTGQLRLNLGGSLAEIAGAVTQAKLFGSSLQEVANAGKSLLDFESSITKELEAELLTGKNLNLEKARSAALAGDQITLQKELAEQMGSLEDFTKMNVIQQEAMAAAMGMTSDQMSDILFKQEIQGKTAQDLRDVGKEELANRLEQQDAQQSFNAAVEQLKGLLADTLKFLDPILQGFSAIVQTAMEFKGLLMAITGAQLLYIGYQKISAAWKKKDLVLGKKGLLQSVAGMAMEGAKSVAKIPFVGPVLAVAALAGLYTAGKALMGDDVMSEGESGGKSGYGKRTLMGPEGAIALNNKDTVIAGTNLFPKENGSSQQNVTNTTVVKPDNGKMESLLSKLVMQNDKKQEISPVGLYEIA